MPVTKDPRPLFESRNWAVGDLFVVVSTDLRYQTVEEATEYNVELLNKYSWMFRKPTEKEKIRYALKQLKGE